MEKYTTSLGVDYLNTRLWLMMGVIVSAILFASLSHALEGDHENSQQCC